MIYGKTNIYVWRLFVTTKKNQQYEDLLNTKNKSLSNDGKSGFDSHELVKVERVVLGVDSERAGRMGRKRKPIGCLVEEIVSRRREIARELHFGIHHHDLF
jgi:hypothetical protein